MSYIWFTREPDVVVELKNARGKDDGDSRGKHNKSFFLVCGPVLRLVSPVWSALLDPTRWFEPLPTTTLNGQPMPLLKLYGDDQACLGWIFNIIHFHTDQVPRNLEFNELLSMAFLCEKYTLKEAIALWVEVWERDFIDIPLDSPESIGREGPWLFMDHVFPQTAKRVELRRRIFERLVDGIVGNIGEGGVVYLETRIEGETQLREIDLTMVPKSTLDEIRDTRNSNLEVVMFRLKTLASAIDDIHAARNRNNQAFYKKSVNFNHMCAAKSCSRESLSAMGPNTSPESRFCEWCYKDRFSLSKIRNRIPQLVDIHAGLRGHSSGPMGNFF